MPWTYRENPNLQIIEVAYSGITTANDLQESTSDLIALEREKGLNRFLVDTTEMVYSGSLVDVYNLVSKQYIQEGADRNGRVAVILPTFSRDKETVNFYETVCKNRGWNVKVFLARQEAVNWLTSSP